MFKCLTALILVFALLSTGSVYAGGIEWNVDPDFKKNTASLELSGAICAGNDGKQNWCYAINDEKKYFQLFSIDGRTLKPGKRIRILEKRGADGNKNGEPDLEAIAYANGFVYMVGSHGRSRKKGELDSDSFWLFRMPVDSETGQPQFEVSNNAVSVKIEKVNTLRVIIKNTDGLREFAEIRLQENGANVEGIAVLEADLFFGFRAPVTKDGTVVLQVAVDRLFGESTSEPVRHFLNLGTNYGIRDMVAHDGRILILTGGAQDHQLVPVVWSWRPESTPRLLTVLDTPSGYKAESLMVLEQDDDHLKVLVLFDSRKNGEPLEFEIPSK